MGNEQPYGSVVTMVQGDIIVYPRSLSGMNYV